MNCWALLCHVYREELGVELPSYAEEYVNAEEESELWALAIRVTRGGSFETPLHPRPGDAILTSLAGRMHVGVLVVPDEWMMTTRIATDSKLDRLRTWKNVSYWRHLRA